MWNSHFLRFDGELAIVLIDWEAETILYSEQSPFLDNLMGFCCVFDVLLPGPDIFGVKPLWFASSDDGTFGVSTFKVGSRKFGEVSLNF